VLVARIHHHGSTHDASTNLVVLADVMAPGLPIHRSTFFAGGDIGPAHLTNLLRMDGLKRWRENSVVYSVVEILLLLVLLEALFGRQFSWWKVTFFFSSFLLVIIG
jgi:hypothetical protein